MIIDEDVYLEHFGVKGMKWGVSKKRAIAVGIGTAVAVKTLGVVPVAVGAAFIFKTMKSKGNTPVKELAPSQQGKGDN